MLWFKDNRKDAMQWLEVIDNPYFKNLPFKQHGYETPYSHSPELCIEIVSPFSIKILTYSDV